MYGAKINTTVALKDKTVEELEKILDGVMTVAAQEYSIPGFLACYKKLHGNDVHQYQVDEWLVPIFGMDSHDLGLMLEAFRGSWKTTTISITWGAYWMGHHPERANMVIASSGGSANKITEAITSIIEHSKVWKEVFPNIVPDKEKGWGENGYEIKRDDIPYDEWKSINSARGDSSLIGLGIGSKTLIGKHPDGFLLMDDILDEDNTSSVRQMSGVATKVTGTVLPFIVEDDTQPEGQRVLTKTIVIGTPWQDDDVYQDLKDTGEFISSKVPIMTEVGDPDGDPPYGVVFIDHEKLHGWYKLTDPKKHSVESVIRLYNRSGHKEFMRMYMLDLSVKMEGEGLAFRLYPHEKIDWSWVMTCGVDYMSIRKGKVVDLRNRDYYAQAYFFKMPDGRGVIGDGWHGRPTQAGAETRMGQAEVFEGHRMTVFEEDGKGEEALQVFLRNPDLTIVPMTTKGRGKDKRLFKELGPWLENGKILISDGDTPFLNFLRKCLNKYGSDYFDDPIDAVYWAVRGMPEVLTLDKPKDRLPGIKKKKKSKNPWLSVGSN